MTLRILGKKNMTWRRPASFTEAPSLIAARSWFGCIPYSTARHWISLWASSSAFMLFARTSNLRNSAVYSNLCQCTELQLPMLLQVWCSHQRSQKKHCLQLLRISLSLSPSGESWEWILLDAWFRDVKRWPYFSRNGRKMSNFKRGIPVFSKASTSSQR